LAAAEPDESPGLNRKPQSWHRKTWWSSGSFLSNWITRMELQRRQRKLDHLRNY